MECEFIEYQSDETGIGVIGKVLQTSVEADKMKDGKVDIDAMKAITFDPYTHCMLIPGTTWNGTVHQYRSVTAGQTPV